MPVQKENQPHSAGWLLSRLLPDKCTGEITGNQTWGWWVVCASYPQLRRNQWDARLVWPYEKVNVTRRRRSLLRRYHISTSEQKRGGGALKKRSTHDDLQTEKLHGHIYALQQSDEKADERITWREAGITRQALDRDTGTGITICGISPKVRCLRSE